MRLLNTTSFTLTTFFDSLVPPYVILSHTWGPEEVSFQDIASLPTTSQSSGFRKIRLACDQAARDGFDWIWIDTCCIDKTSSAELSESINSMFKWYQRSTICYAFLQDVLVGSECEAGFRKSRWFTRGWTLQELIAPKTVEFYDTNWQEIGTKWSLCYQVARITGIDLATLRGGDLQERNVAERMSWAAERKTTRDEDMAYCLMGLFNINMPMLYGEGGAKAFVRLQEEIMKTTDDYTLFAWRHESFTEAGNQTGFLALAPSQFRDESHNFYSGLVLDRRDVPISSPPTLTSKGLSINIALRRFWALSHEQRFTAYLRCQRSTDNFMLCIQLRGRDGSHTYSRMNPAESHVFINPKTWIAVTHAQIYIGKYEGISRDERLALTYRTSFESHLQVNPRSSPLFHISEVYTPHAWYPNTKVVKVESKGEEQRSEEGDSRRFRSITAVFECRKGTEALARVAIGNTPDGEPWCALALATGQTFGDDRGTLPQYFEQCKKLADSGQPWPVSDRDRKETSSGDCVSVSIRKRPALSNIFNRYSVKIISLIEVSFDESQNRNHDYSGMA